MIIFFLNLRYFLIFFSSNHIVIGVEIVDLQRDWQSDSPRQFKTTQIWKVLRGVRFDLKCGAIMEKNNIVS